MSGQNRSHGEIETWELEAYLDGQADSEVQGHVARCSICQSQISAHRALDQQLTHRLYRFDCPTLDQLRDFCWHMVPPSVNEAIVEHLERCPHCQEEVESLQQVLVMEPLWSARSPDREWWLETKAKVGAVRTVMAQLLSPPLQPAFALRTRVAQDLVYQAEDTLVAINPVSSTRGYMLTGQLLTSDWESWINTQAELLDAAGNPVATVPLDETGSFAFVEVPTGHWTIRIRGDKVEIILPQVSL